jgi:hypothetical protein
LDIVALRKLVNGGVNPGGGGIKFFFFETFELDILGV